MNDNKGLSSLKIIKKIATRIWKERVETNTIKSASVPAKWTITLNIIDIS